MSNINRREFVAVSGVAAGLTALGTKPSQANTGRVRVVDLKADYRDRPLDLENPAPRLSWRLESRARGVRQSAYRVWVASSEALLQTGQADLWDSGKVNSSRSFGIQYRGAPLQSRQRCWWRVQIWDEQGLASTPSAPEGWAMGLLDPKDWTAEWLTYEGAVTRADREAGLRWIWDESRPGQGRHCFRCPFNLPVASLGGAMYAVTHEWSWFSQITRVWLDGKPVAGPGRLIDHHEIAPSQVADTLANWIALEPLSAGKHLIAIEVATPERPSYMPEGSLVDGLAMLARFNLSNGEPLRVQSGRDWKVRSEAMNDWYQPGHDDAGWSNAQAAPIEDYQPWPEQPAVHLRRTFALEKPVSEARLYATALGAYEARLNGRPVGNARLAPEVSRYDKRVLYQVYDVTEQVQRGENVLGLTLGEGWYGGFLGRYPWGPPPRRVLAQLELTFADGSRQTMGTGSGWRAVQSPIRSSQMRVGEIYDARFEQAGWDTTPFDDSHWQDAEIAAAPTGRLVAQASQPVRVTQTLKAHTISQPKPQIFVFDFGQNFAGWCRLHVKGSRGTRVELKFAELLAPSGEVMQQYVNIGEPKRDVYILKGDPAGERFEPHFTYRGFRYVQVSGLETPPTAETLEGLVAHSDLKITGQFRCEAALIEQLWRNIVWTQRSNFVSIATDCPSREQTGWTGDAAMFWDAAAFNMDIEAFTARQLENIVDDQAPEGVFPVAAPVPQHNSPFFHAGGSPAWSDAGIILPWIAWQRYGDLTILERHWEAMNRYARFIQERNPDYLWRNGRGFDYGDLFELAQPKNETPKVLIATAYWAHSLDLLAQMGEAIGRAQEATQLRALRGEIAQAFHKAFVNADGAVGNDTQTGYVLALQFGLLPQALRQAAAERLAKNVREHGVALTTGFVATPFILDVLADAGYTDLAYGLLLKTAYPSWGYMIERGGTTIWETWSGEKDDDGKVYKKSQNHFALGAVGGFLFRRIAGIDAATPGFERISIRPAFDPRVKRGGGDYDSVMGRISTDWAWHDNGQFTLDVTLPANTTARIHLPAPPGTHVLESRRDITGRRDVRLIERSIRETLVEVGSGEYHFTL